MNSLWISRLSDYRQTRKCLGSATEIIKFKIMRRGFLLKQYGYKAFNTEKIKILNIQDVLLFEARAAGYFWKKFSLIIPKWCQFRGRKPRRIDIINKLLDIGYHNLTNEVRKILEKHDIYGGLGIFHKPHKSNSSPLAYDLVELFRADIVDSEVIRFMKLKKKPFAFLDEKQIARFLKRINKRLDKKYFIKEFKQCHTYRYYIELQILKFIKAINYKEIFKPFRLPLRHETRCK